MCHTSTPANNVSRVLKGANSPTTILNAINSNVGGMIFLKGTISSQDASDLAAYLATPGI
jgi:mono/diheme cytochrome c family protein